MTLREDSAEQRPDLRAARLAHISSFRRALPVIGAVHFVNAALTAAVFWTTAPRAFMLAWVCLIWLAAFRCYQSWRRQRGHPPPTEISQRTVHRAVISALVMGLLWGVAGIFLFRPDAMASQLFLIFITGGMAAGITAAVPSMPSLWSAFVLPSIAPLIGRLAVVGDSLQLAMAMMLVVFTIALAAMMWTGYASFVADQKNRLRLATLARTIEESERRYRTLVEQAPDAIITTCAGKIVFVNPAAVRMFGATSAAQLVGRTTLDLVHPESRIAVEQRIRALLELEQSVLLMEQTWVRLDGSDLAVEVTSARIDWEGGAAVKVIARDVTERRQRSRELAEKSVLMKAILDHMGQGMSVFDGNLKLVAWNDRAFDLLEFPASFARIGTPYEDFVRFTAARGEYGPGDVDAMVRERVDLSKRFLPHRFEQARPDGTVVEIRDNPLPGGGFVTTYTDITESKKVERQLRESREFLQTAIDAIPAVINVKDEASRLIMVNHYLADRYGIDRGEVIGKTLEELGLPYARHAKMGDEQVIRTGRPISNDELKIDPGDGLRTWLETKVPIEDADGVVRFVLTIAFDIDERKRMEQALRDSQRFLKTVIDSIPAVVNVKDKSRRYVLVNKHLAERGGGGGGSCRKR